MSNQNTEGSPEYSSRLKEIIHIIRKNELFRGITPEKLRSTLEDLGPTFIKIGQVMAGRSDILPQEYCDELMKLQSDVVPMAYEEVAEVIETSYGRPWEDVFSWIDKAPLGSASIAQVHRATLKDGQDVVVKVQRKGIYELMKRDIGLMHKAVRFLPFQKMKGVLNLDMILDEMWVVTQEEMDFLAEASNMEEFAKLNADVKFVSVPHLYRPYTTEHVLVMEYIDGIAVDDKDSLAAGGYDLDEIGTKMVDNYVKQVMEDGFFHADPHPGNIVIREGKIVWIDMGMMGRLSNHDRELIKKAITGVAHKDVGEIMDAVLALAQFRETPDKSRLYKDLDNMFSKYAAMDLGEIDIADFLRALTETMKKNQLVMPHGLTLLARGLTQMEGVLIKISPSLSILQIAVNRLKADYMDPEYLKKALKEKGQDLLEAADALSQLPTMATKILREYERGETRIRLDLHSAEQLTQLLHHLVRNLVIGFCEAALLISASIICTTQMRPRILGIPALGFLGYLGAVCVAAFFVLRYFIRKHNNK